MSLESMLSEGAQRMGDLVLDILEGIGNKIGGLVSAAGTAIATRTQGYSHESVSTPMKDGERVYVSETPRIAAKSQAIGRSQEIALDGREEEEIVMPPNVKDLVKGIKDKNMALAYSAPTEAELGGFSPVQTPSMGIQRSQGIGVA